MRRFLSKKPSVVTSSVLISALILAACSGTAAGNSSMKEGMRQTLFADAAANKAVNKANVSNSSSSIITSKKQNQSTSSPAKKESKSASSPTKKESKSASTPAKKESKSSSAPAKKEIVLEKYQQPGVFTMQKPKGWLVYKAGEFNTLAFMARDNKEPLRQIFCFSEIGPFYTSEWQKKLEQSYVSSGGYQIQWLDMPVVSPLNGTSFMQKLNDIFMTDIGKGFLSLYGMPKPAGIEKISICSETKLPDYFNGMGTALIRALLFSNGKAAEGLFVVSGAPDAYGHAYAFMVTGITMPKDEFGDALPVLLKAVESFTIDQEYLKKGMQAIAENGEMLRQISDTLSKTSDSMADYWDNRSKSEDVWTQKESDKNLGLERVYDENTGEVYQVQNGFYDYYQTHENQYPNRRLQPLPEDSYDLWTRVPRTDNSLVVP